MNNMKTPAHEMIPGDVFHPGEFLLDELEARGMKQVQLAEQLGLSKSEVSLIVNGKRNITVHVAVMLEKVLGISAETWMDLQVRYDINLVKLKMAKSLSRSDIGDAQKDSLREVVASV